MKRSALWYGMLLLVMLMVVSCGGRPRRVSEWSIAYHDLKTDRIEICDVNGEHKRMLTPDSLRAFLPSSDSTGHLVAFVGAPRNGEAGPYSIYKIESDGSALELVTALPFKPNSLAFSPGGRFVLFGARYPDDEHDRLYLYRFGSEGFRAIVPGARSAYNPVFSPIETNFVCDLDPPSDTGWVGFVTGEIPLPIYNYELRQVTFHRSGEFVVGLCDPDGEALCRFWFRTLTDSVILQPETPKTVLAHPSYCPDGRLICYEFTEPGDANGPQLGIWDANANDNNKLYGLVNRAARPAWVR